jgi:hypothetical protein
LGLIPDPATSTIESVFNDGGSGVRYNTQRGMA